jgi:hypothetical protein
VVSNRRWRPTLLHVEVLVSRIRFMVVPVLCALAAGCGPGEVGDSCKEDDDCDTEAGLVCEKADGATADDEGTCQEEAAS